MKKYTFPVLSTIILVSLLGTAYAFHVAAYNAAHPPLPVTTPKAVVTQAAADHDFTIEEVRTRKATLEGEMAKVIALASGYEKVDKNLLVEAQKQLEIFQVNFAAISLQKRVGGALKVIAKDDCAVGVKPCFYFAVAQFDHGDDTPVASWNPQQQILYMSPRVSIDDAYTPFITEHELSHVFDTMQGYVAHGDPMYPLPDTEEQSETFAYMFEAELVDAASGGRYSADIRVLTDAVQARRVDFLTILPGPVTYVYLPNEFYAPLAQFGTVSKIDRDSFALTALISMNRELITRTTSDDKIADQAQRVLYSDLMVDLHDARVQSLVRGEPQPVAGTR